MQLSFRGIHYEAEPQVLEVEEGEVGGTYRGKPWKVHRYRQQPRSSNTHELKYRGVRYTH